MKIYTYMKQCADKYVMNIELTAIAGLNCLFRVLSLLVLETDNNGTICPEMCLLFYKIIVGVHTFRYCNIT